MTAYAPVLSTASDRAAAAGTPHPARVWIVGGTLAIAAAVVAGILLFRPWPARNAFLYADLAPVRDAIWAAVFADALAFAAISISISLAVGMLVSARGARLANVGAIVTMAGGILFAVGAFAFAAFTWYVTDPSGVSPELGAQLLAYAVANPEHLLLPQGVGFLLFTLGTLILGGALLRSRAVPRWLPILLVLATAAQFFVEGRALDLAQVGVMGVLVLLGALSIRAATGRQ